MRKHIRKLLFFEIPDSSLETVRAQIMEENRRFAIIWALTQMAYWTYCLVMTTRRADFLTCRSIYLTSFAVCAAALVLAVFAAPRVPWLVPPIALAEDIALLGAGIGIARLFAPRTIIVFASVLLVPVFFISDMLSTGILLIINAVTFALIGRSTLEPETYQWTLVNLLLFSSVGLIFGYFINKARYERYYYAESAMQLAQSNAKLAALQTRYANYDELTGLQNRRAYAEKYDELAEHIPDGCCVVMVDINGLKEINDTRGHEAGDELLIGAAECLRQSFADEDLIYRIGGDEFCVVMTGTADRAAACLRELENNGRRWKGQFVDGISVSCGYASDKEFADFDSMLKAADQRMYDSKSDYYRDTGRDRHRR